MAHRIRLILWSFVALAAALLGTLLWRERQGDLPLSAPSSQPLAVPSSILSGSSDAANRTALAGLGGRFTLVGSDGQPFSSAALAGRPYVIFFGFTHCPDVCPTTLARLAKLRAALGRGEQAFAILFVTVDPERDTPAAVGRYSGLFGTPVIGLTGTSAQIDAMRKSWGIFAQKSATGGDDYTIDHTATVFVVGRDGKPVSTIAPDEADAPALAKLRRIAS